MSGSDNTILWGRCYAAEGLFCEGRKTALLMWVEEVVEQCSPFIINTTDGKSYSVSLV